MKTPALPTALPAAPHLWLWVLLALATAALIALIVFLVWQARKAAQRIAATPAGTLFAAEATLALPTGMPEGFSGALHMLSADAPANTDFRYSLPWILLLGPHGSGKSSLVEESRLLRERRESVELKTGTGLTWNFLGQGLLIEVSGWAYSTAPKAAEAWQRFSRLLLNSRPARPLEGVVLTVPADELMSFPGLAGADPVERGALIHKRLQQLTLTTSFQLPVYVVVTKCDLVPGFTEFTGELAPEEFDQMFGWSQPLPKLTPFDPEWVDMAFDSMRIALERKQSRLFAQRTPSPGRDDMFLFPGELLRLAPALAAMLTRAMRSSDGVQAPLLRGIYCCGSVSGRHPGAPETAPLVPVSVPAGNALQGMLGASARGFLDLTLDPSTARSGLQAPLWDGPEPKIGFVYDLLMKKVFEERGVAIPLPQRLISRNRVRTALQAATVALALTLGIGTAVSYHREFADKQAIDQLFDFINEDLARQKLLGGSDSSFQRRIDAGALIQLSAGLRTKGLHSIFIPAYLVDGVDEPIRQTMAPVFSALVLKPLRGGLVHRLQRIGDQDLMASPGAEGDSCRLQRLEPARRLVTARDEDAVTEPPRRVEDLPEYRQMRGYLQQVATLEGNLETYNQLSTQGVGMPLQTILALDEYVQCQHSSTVIEQPANPYFAKVFQQSTQNTIDYSNGSRPITDKAAALTTELYSAWIERNPVRQVTNTLARRITLLESPAAVSARQLNDTQLAFSIASNTYKNPDLAWAAADDFHMPSDLANVTVNAFPSSKLFEATLPDRMNDRARSDFLQLVDAVDKEETPLTGPLVTVHEGEMSLSERARDLEVALTNLMALDFMAAASGESTAASPTPANLTWDRAALDSAAALPASYRRYLAEDLQEAPLNVRTLLHSIASTQLSHTLERAISLAMVSAPPISDDSRAADLSAQVQNFSSVQPTIDALLASLGQLNLGAPQEQLSRASLEQASLLLSAFNKALNADAPYGVRSDRFALWTGGAKPTLEVLGTPTADALVAYLATQRTIVQSYATAARQLVTFLRLHRRSISEPNVRLLARWEGIMKAVDEYDAKQPGNSIQLLEDFITTGANGISPNSGCVLPPARGSSGPDYFVVATLQLRSGLLQRCQVLATDSYETRYRKLAQTFNSGLAGLFPFAPVDSSTAIEADPQTIANVFSQRDAASDLFAAKADMPIANRVFLDELQASRPWFASLLSTVSVGAVPTLDLAPTFRVNQANEIGGNQIIAWTLQVGSDTYRYGDAQARGTWSLYQPIVLTLRWAKDAAYVPAPAAGQPHPGYKLSVQGDTVTYTFEGAWSLIRMVDALTPQGQNFSSSGTQDVFTLVLTVPEVAASAQNARLQSTPTVSARVYLRLQISTPAGAGDKVTLTNRSFPFSAPPSSSGP